jgi:nephrocystin-3
MNKKESAEKIATSSRRPAGAQDRVIRVFISSTFRDMQEERDYLVKFIFPQLRKLYAERAVAWTEVDLRWGVTDEEKAEAGVLSYCLAEIERCRPYFIGILGERYGWVPKEIDQKVLESQPWLEEHLEHSITELEIIHGVLNNPAIADRSIFYFRDPAYIQTLPPEEQKRMVDEVVPIVPSPQGKPSIRRIDALKDRIRAAWREKKLEYEPHENYENPEALGELVLEDFTKILNELYPIDKVPDPLDQESAQHDAYARSRRFAFVGRNKYLERLNNHVEAGGTPLVITGESGCGKSALLAEWSARWRKANPEDLIIQHYIGSSPGSADWNQIVTRILGELKRTFKLSEDLPTQPESLRPALGDWLTKTAGSRRIVIVLDALNQLHDIDAGRQLGWLPSVFPANVRFLCSSLSGPLMDLLSHRGWTVESLPLFTSDEVQDATIEFLKIYGRVAPRDMIRRLQTKELAKNPLFLRAFLDELRQFGDYEKLPDQMDFYLRAKDLDELFGRIVDRWSHDFGESLVKDSLCYVASARYGLSETEILDLLGQNGNPLPRREWTPFYLAAENSLLVRAGMLNFGHDFIRRAVAGHWLQEESEYRPYREQMARYFGLMDAPVDRKLDELPWLLLQLGQKTALKDLLADIPLFMRMRSREQWKQELNRYWIALDDEHDAGHVYVSSLAAYERLVGSGENIAFPLNAVANFLFERGKHADAEPLMRRVVEISKKNLGEDHPNIAKALNNLALLLLNTNRLGEAEPLLRRAVEIFEKSLGENHPSVAKGLHNLAQLLYATNRLREAEPLMRRALEIYEKSLGKEHPDVALGLNSLALLLCAKNQLAEAERLLMRAVQICQASLVPGHPQTQAVEENLEALLRHMGKG